MPTSSAEAGLASVVLRLGPVALPLRIILTLLAMVPPMTVQHCQLLLPMALLKTLGWSNSIFRQVRVAHSQHFSMARLVQQERLVAHQLRTSSFGVTAQQLAIGVLVISV